MKATTRIGWNQVLNPKGIEFRNLFWKSVFSSNVDGGGRNP